MNFLDMGMMEIGLILLIALLVFGPGSIPKVASQLGKAVHTFRKITTDLSKDFGKAIDTEEKETKGKETKKDGKKVEKETKSKPKK